MANAPDVLGKLQKDLQRALTLIDNKRDEYEKARDYYNGTRAEVSASKAIRAMIEKNAEASPICLAHIPVDVIADKVELASLTAAEKAAADALAIIVDKNNLDDEADDWVRKAAYFGDYYVIADPTAEDNDGNIAPEDIKTVGSSPLSTVMVYDSKDGRTALYGAKTWKTGKHTRALLYYDDVTVKLIADGDHPPADEYFPDLELGESADDLDHYVEHPGDRMLLHHLAIESKPYGTPLHKKAWGPQDAITKISATNLNNVDGQGFASRWALADPLAEIDDDMDDDFGDAGPTPAGEKASDGLTTPTTGASRVRSVPGAIAILRGIKQVGQFDATSSEDFLKNLDWYVRVMAVACGIALFEFDLNGEQPSGESRRRAEGRANKKAAKVKRQAGAFFRDIGDTCLALLGTAGTVAATFNPSETATDKDGLELVALKIKAGVPIAQALLEAGYTDEQVSAWYPDGQPHVTPDLLTVLAVALAQLGNAKTLGVITDEELRDMLPTFLTAARNEGPATDDELDEEEDTGIVADPATRMKAQAEAMGILIRSGVDQEEAAARVGLDGLSFPNLPTTIRVPEAEAAGLEGTAPAAPGAAA